MKNKIIILIIGIIVGAILATGEILVFTKMLNQNAVSPDMMNMRDGQGNGQLGGDMQGQVSNANSATYSAIKEITEDAEITEGEFLSDTSDENAVLASGDIDVEISNISVTKTGDSDGGDNTSFYGTNSGIIAKDGSNLILKNVTVNTNADRSKWRI